MAWLGLLALMLLIAAAPGVSLLLEYRRAAATERADGVADSTQHA
jgi:threonine/homoserine/homoserine lactone efflux protein